jgi:hypothetical protein
MPETPRGEMPEAQKKEPKIQSASAEVTGYGSPKPGSPPAKKHLVEYHYREVSPGILQPVLREGTPWTIDGKPVQKSDVPEGWRAEVGHRIPDEEHGWKWEEEGYELGKE